MTAANQSTAAPPFVVVCPFFDPCENFGETRAHKRLWGLSYMTSALGGGRGVPKKQRRKEQNQLNSVHDKGGGGKKSKKNRTSWIPLFLLPSGL